MSLGAQNPYQVSYGGFAGPAALAEEDARVAFIRRTYLHLAGAIAAFVAIEAAIFTLLPAAMLENAMQLMFASRWGWLAVLAGFMGISWLAQTWASSDASQSVQYLGLGLYIVAEAVVFLPLLWVASKFAPAAIPAAGLLTLVVFGGLTAMVFITRTDLTSWGKYLWCLGFAALGVIIAAVIFNFELGVWFSGIMIGLASAYILYDTSNVLHRYRTEQYVAASLALFASVALLFWYILRLMMELNRR
jgi:FtsH-binding integral membrane protein